MRLYYFCKDREAQAIRQVGFGNGRHLVGHLADGRPLYRNGIMCAAARPLRIPDGWTVVVLEVPPDVARMTQLSDFFGTLPEWAEPGLAAHLVPTDIANQCRR